MTNSGSRKNTTLSWVRKNGETAEDREFDEKKYYEAILSLWFSYVNYSGDTYYPSLQEELYFEFEKYTKKNVGNPFAIVLDKQVISAPIIQSHIPGGAGIITGNTRVSGKPYSRIVDDIEYILIEKLKTVQPANKMSAQKE